MSTMLVCQTCKKRYPSSTPLWRCPCGGFLSLDFHARFPLEKIQKRPPTMWRYREALPIEKDSNIVSFHEGFTPLIHEEFAGKKILLKLDYLFPSGSYKDRGASVLVSKTRELHIKHVVEDSSGNAGAAIAAYCAKAGIACDIYVPENTSVEKLVQIQQYGAQVHRIPGSREDTAAAIWNAAQKTYYASHYWNPFFFHGTKTFVFEVVEQLGWKAPDALILPVGNGTLLYGSYLGLQELQREKIIHDLPKIIGVQASNCSPLAHAWKNKQKTVESIQTKGTIAEGIAIAQPVQAQQILSAIKETNGSLITVYENEILQALKETIQSGYYIEPTAAAAVAAVKKYKRKKNEVIVVPLTGHGLKTAGVMKKVKKRRVC